MTATAYYNEIDPYAAQWLRNLIDAGHIAPGVVDERSIEDVHPSDLAGFTQCHFFAGIGVWSYALRRAGWPDDRPVWTGSCPCQPFSSAGKGTGFADERHLWPAFHWLIQERRPPVVYGEQVASSDVGPWLDLVQADLEGMDYAIGCVAFPSAGVGAPHIRDRLYWVADANGSAGRERRAHLRGRVAGGDAQPRARLGCGCLPDRLADDHQHGRRALPERRVHDAQHHAEPCSSTHGLADASRADQQRHGGDARSAAGPRGGEAPPAHGDAHRGAGGLVHNGQPGPTNGLWRDADWLFCRDGRWRPVEPGTFPLAHGAPARVGRLRAYGNAINAEAARIFIESTMRAAA